MTTAGDIAEDGHGNYKLGCVRLYITKKPTAHYTILINIVDELCFILTKRFVGVIIQSYI